MAAVYAGWRASEPDARPYHLFLSGFLLGLGLGIRLSYRPSFSPGPAFSSICIGSLAHAVPRSATAVTASSLACVCGSPHSWPLPVASTCCTTVWPSLPTLFPVGRHARIVHQTRASAGGLSPHDVRLGSAGVWPGLLVARHVERAHRAIRHHAHRLRARLRAVHWGNARDFCCFTPCPTGSGFSWGNTPISRAISYR